MNKYKKIAAAVVATVMAGTMVASLAACGPKDDGPKGNGYTDDYGILNDDGSINYDAYKRDSEVTLNIAIGHSDKPLSTTFADTLGKTITLPDGKQYSAGDLKPAWAAMGKDLNITWNDVWDGSPTSSNLTNLLKNNVAGSTEKQYTQTDLFTSDLSVVVDQVSKGTSVLNLADYLDYMPNFNKFLNDNPIVYLSLLQDGMNTETGEGKELYVAPYFDGNDDIERYCLIRKDWTEKLLNGDVTGSTKKYSEALNASAKVSASYFGNTAYEIESLNSAGTAKQTIKKDYPAAKTAAADTTSGLGAAYSAIAGGAYGGDSGNIVDIMNAAIVANPDATGAQLLKLYTEYIDVCYKVGTNAAYAKDSRANLFNGYDAAWDVDDLVAMLRVILTNPDIVADASHTVVGVVPRGGNYDRIPDIVSLAAQLYGARGATSRFEYTYIAKDGTLKDARNDKAFYQAMANLHQFVDEGLIPLSDAQNMDYSATGGLNGTEEAFMMYDYSQTQTKNGFYYEEDSLANQRPAGITKYNFAPILTPVAKWDVDGDDTYGEDGEIMRFTESWRSTKTGGLALNGALANNEAKLKAALQFVDYLYSADGQIVSSYGPMAEDADGKNGFWYNEPAGANDTNTFTFKGVKYKGTEYKGRYTPTMTKCSRDYFMGLAVKGGSLADSKDINKAGSYTDYARRVIGSTLPVGVKDQSFENQCTAKCGKDGADIVSKALAEGVVKGMTLTLDPNNWWYTVVPTGLPVPELYVGNLTADAQQNFRKFSGDLIDSTVKKNRYNIFYYIVLYGTNVSDTTGLQSADITNMGNLDAILTKMRGTESARDGIVARLGWLQKGWEQAKEYGEYLGLLNK